MATNGKKINTKKREATAKKIITAISESSGLLTLAARKSGVSYQTVWRYTQDFPSVKQAVVEAKERMLDFTEGKLYEKIKEGDNVSIIFYLKTQGKKRGYLERQEITGAGGGPVEVNIDAKIKLFGILTHGAARIRDTEESRQALGERSPADIVRLASVGETESTSPAG